jgi:hypothetical protein
MREETKRTTWAWSSNYRYYAVVNGRRVGPLLPYCTEGRQRAEKIAYNVFNLLRAASCSIATGHFTDAQLEAEKQG